MHIGVDGRERIGLVQVHDALDVGFGPHALGVIGAMADDHTAASVLHIFEMQVEHLPAPQPALQHEEHHRPVARTGHGGHQACDLVIRQGPRHTLDAAKAQAPAHRSTGMPGRR